MHPTHAHTQLRLYPVLERRATHTPHEGYTGPKGAGSRRKGSGWKGGPGLGKSGGLLTGGGGGSRLGEQSPMLRAVPASYQMGVGTDHSFPAPELTKGSEPPASMKLSVKWGLTPLQHRRFVKLQEMEGGRGSHRAWRVRLWRPGWMVDAVMRWGLEDAAWTDEHVCTRGDVRAACGWDGGQRSCDGRGRSPMGPRPRCRDRLGPAQALTTRIFCLFFKDLRI